jgi:hypothetical protein
VKLVVKVTFSDIVIHTGQMSTQQYLSFFTVTCTNKTMSQNPRVTSSHVSCDVTATDDTKYLNWMIQHVVPLTGMHYPKQPLQHEWPAQVAAHKREGSFSLD